MSQKPVGVQPAAKPRVSLGRRRQLERDLEHITQEMYRRNRELAETNKTLSLLGTVDALTLESHAPLGVVCDHITEAIAQVTDYDFVGLLTRSVSQTDTVTLHGWSGRDFLGKKASLGLTKPLQVPLDHDWFVKRFGSHQRVNLSSLGDDRIAAFLHISNTEMAQLSKRLQLKTAYVVKLVARHRIVGLLVIGLRDELQTMTDFEQKLINRLSESIGVALDNKLLFEENRSVLRQLKVSNAKLKALDEAKDDFISMASHQLRTPLTSVKGYISMVMEEDAGKVNQKQREMLGQAFFSSQRMVYLIADLLNVSRLRTGKFVIERRPVNLANVVEEELQQLTETAKSRSLKLSYVKPKRFPDLMLDETKTRQVIMNFVDNAIYYTPSGGHISVNLIENPQTVALRVCDDGIGVPKSEQHHLFTKFYRAGNARKVRPDGTGLGLFMAKKVIIAQGGALLFESQEGQGSSFGFEFSKAKLAVTTPQKDQEK